LLRDLLSFLKLYFWFIYAPLGTLIMFWTVFYGLATAEYAIPIGFFALFAGTPLAIIYKRRRDEEANKLKGHDGIYDKAEKELKKTKPI